MAQLYQRIDGSHYAHIYVIGDLHGCYRLLQQRLKEVGFNPNTDLLLSVGDLIDRGENSLACLKLIEQPWFKAVRGNHEQMAIDALNKEHGECLTWVINGGVWFTELSEAERQEAKKLFHQYQILPLIIELDLEGEKVVIAHADYPSNHYDFDKEIDSEKVIWNRDRLLSNDQGSIDGALLFIFGHTPLKEIKTVANRVYIDTGAFFSGRLTLYKLKG
ncbi:metallophosphoesterase [Glaesserella sp.]|uniref:metallophosphoesterase n=1 Tax=Glaesserella sp. TaxID=2094731 RepID=UPI00359FFFFC